MTKGTKAFRIIICVLLALTMLCSAFFTFAFAMHISKDVMGEEYGIFVAGVPVTRSNEDDILGDGTVFYDSYNNTLVFGDANIEFDNTIIYSEIDLTIHLIGENRFVATNEVYSIGIFAGDNHLSKDLAFVGDGSLTIELPNSSTDCVGIFASNLIVDTDVTVKTSDCEKSINAIVCDSSLILGNKATLTVNSGASAFSSAIRVRGNALLEEGTAINVSTAPGTSGSCKGLSVSGDLFLGKNTTLNVSIDDAATDLGECVRVSGFMEVGNGATVTASAKNTYAIECFGAIEANKDATVSANSENNAVDVFCAGAVVNYGAEITGEIDAIAGINNRG